MALMHGKNANIYWDAADSATELQHGQSWTLDIPHDVADVTAMQDTWRTFIGGYKDWTATVTCLLDSAGTDIGLGGDDGMADDECKLELYCLYDTVTPLYKALYGSAICTGATISTDKDGIPTVTYSFQGAAQIQWHSGAAKPAY